MQAIKILTIHKLNIHVSLKFGEKMSSSNVVKEDHGIEGEKC